MIGSVRILNHPHLEAIHGTTFDSTLIRITVNTPRYSRLVCWHGRWSWTRAAVIAGIANKKACVTA